MTTQQQPIDDPRELAPLVDPSWIRSFVAEQVNLGVPGRAIGDELILVNSHVADSGESALDAFGPARDYARELAAAGPTRDASISTGGILAMATFLAADFALSLALLDGRPDGVIGLRSGDVASFGLIALLTAAAVKWRRKLLPTGSTWQVLIAIFVVCGFTGYWVGSAMVRLDHHLLDVPMWLGLLVAVALVGVSARLMWQLEHTVVSGPGGTSPQLDRWLRGLSAAVFPVMFVAIGVAMWVFG